MGLLDFFFKKKKEPEIDYESIIAKCWDIFRQGFKHPNPEIRSAVEKAVFNVESPDGKRFFAVGMQDPDLSNRAFCLKKIYARGGWRLAENILKIAYTEEDLSIEVREELIYFLAGFSDPSASDFMTEGLNHHDPALRIATLAAICGVKGGDKANLLVEHLNKVENDLEKFTCALALFQFSKPEGKPIVDELFETNAKNPEFIKKLTYLDFNKAQIYIDKVINSADSEIKLLLIEMVQDNRGIDIIKKLLKDTDLVVVNKAIDKVVELGSRSALETLKELKNNKELEKNIKLALVAFGEREEAKEIEEKAKKGSLNDETISYLKAIAQLQEQNISEIIDKLLLPLNNLKTLESEELNKVNQLLEILTKYGKISSMVVLEQYCNLEFLQSEDIPRWVIACNSASAILCIAERNTTYYTLRKKMKEQLN